MSMVHVPRMERENLQPGSKMLIFLRKRIGSFWGTLTFTDILRTEIGKGLISMTCSFSIAPLVIWACLRFLFKGESILGPICSIPLLEKLDCVFTNNSWTLSYLETTCRALVMEVSDQCPIVVSISTSIPKTFIFRFENYQLLRDGFMEELTDKWFAPL